MHNPPHPGEFIADVYLEPNQISGRGLAASLGVSASTLSRILTDQWNQPRNGTAAFKALGRSPETGLRCSRLMIFGKLKGSFDDR